MQGIAAGLYRQVHQLARVQVAGQRVLADEIGLVGTLDVQRMAVGFENTATERTPISAQARTMRTAISPRLAISSFLITLSSLGSLSRRPASGSGSLAFATSHFTLRP